MEIEDDVRSDNIFMPTTSANSYQPKTSSLII